MNSLLNLFFYLNSVSVLDLTAKELLLNTPNTLVLLVTPAPDGPPVLWPIKTPSNSRNPSSCSLLTPEWTDKPSLKLPTSTFPALLFAIPTLPSNSLILLFPATTDPLNPSLWLCGSLPEKSRSSEVNWLRVSEKLH